MQIGSVFIAIILIWR